MSAENIRNEKKKIRQENKEKRAAMDKNARLVFDEKICESIINSVSFKYADVVLMFYPTEQEINILPVFYEALRLGKRVAFPKSFDGRVMKFFYVGDLQSMVKGRYGICEPKESEAFENSVHPLCIVPCLAASTKGERLGYGGSYYDRFLKKFDGISMCVQYDEFVAEELPQEKRYDKKVDIIVTENGVRVIG